MKKIITSDDANKTYGINLNSTPKNVNKRKEKRKKKH